ncbi:MAG: GntR family transcriptional regulator [Lachnospiraceae bacterium]
MIIIDYSDKRPIYEQIAERFQALILSGVLQADEKLPSVRSLAVELSINPNTIQRAFSQLEKDGFVYSVKGIGSFVQASESLVQKKKEKMLKEFADHAESCMKQGITKEELLETMGKVAGEVEV